MVGSLNGCRHQCEEECLFPQSSKPHSHPPLCPQECKVGEGGEVDAGLMNDTVCSWSLQVVDVEKEG